MKPDPTRQDITFEDFETPDIRAQMVTQVVVEADSKELVQLTTGCGDHTRSVVVSLKQERDRIGANILMQIPFSSRKFKDEPNRVLAGDNTACTVHNWIA